MQIFLAFVLLAVVVVVMIMRRSKRRVVSRMQALVDGAKLTTWAILMNDIKSGRITDNLGFDRSTGDGEDKLVKIVAASVNYWFGEEPSKTHEDLDLRHIYADSMRWLSRNDEVRELVVQAARILSMVRYAKTGAVDLSSLYVLEVFGKEYPEAPEQETFEVLLRREMRKLSLDQQESVRRYIG